MRNFVSYFNILLKSKKHFIKINDLKKIKLEEKLY